MSTESISLYGQIYPFDVESWSTFGWFTSGEEIESNVITDHATRAKRLLLEEFRHKHNIDSLVEAYAAPFQELEFVLDDLGKLTSLENSTGQQVDNIAEFAGLKRNGLDDTEFKQAIKTKIVLNSSNGQVETVILAAQFLTGTEVVFVSDLFPAKLGITISGPLPNAIIKTSIQSVMAAGVGLNLSYVPNNQKLFGFKQEGVIPSIHTGLLKENNIDTSATDGLLAELITD